MTGTLYGIGVGPGDPGLLTLKAQQILQQVDLLCVPRSAGDRDSLALQVVQRALDRQFTVLELDFPMSRDRQVLERAWQKAAEMVVDRLQQGLDLAFVTIGDPLFYSTFSYLAIRVRELCPGVTVQAIPGVMAMAGCAAATVMPLAEGEESLLVIPAAYGVEQLREALDKYDNIVLMKVNRQLGRVYDLLQEKGLLSRAFFFSRCGQADGFFVSDRLEELLDRPLDYMSLLIIKKNVPGETV